MSWKWRAACAYLQLTAALLTSATAQAAAQTFVDDDPYTPPAIVQPFALNHAGTAVPVSPGRLASPPHGPVAPDPDRPFFITYRPPGNAP